MYFENKQITIEVTNKCAAKCIMCPRDKMIQPLEVMNQNLYEKIVIDSFKMGVEMINLCGYGDVFLDRGLIEKLKFTKNLKPDCKIYVSTTANAMVPRYFDDVTKYVDILKLSIYGTTPEIYKKVMGGLSYEKFKKNIDAFLAMNKKTTYTIGNFVKMKENEHQMEEWKDIWEKKLTEVYVWKPHNYIDGRNYRDIKGQKQTTCGRPLKGPLNVAVSGKAHVCCFDFNKLMVVGDAKTMTIKEIMNSQEMKKIQKKHQNNDFSDLICKNCDQTVKDDTVLIYKSNPSRKVGTDNTTLYSWR